jgi:hypothetical protein
MRFKKTYTPPVSGNSQLSSAHTSAAQSVNKPETSHARITPRPLGTSRIISEGCTKMNAPTMIPTTIAVAAVSPMERLSSVDMECVKAARFYHAPGINLLQLIFASANLCFDHSSLELQCPINSL